MDFAPYPPDTIYFPDAPDADPIDDVLYRLRRPFCYTTLDKVMNGVVIFVPADFRTDLLSAPRLMWTLTGMSPDGLYRSAAVIHDFLYSSTGQYGGNTYTRKECDQLLLEIMERLKINAVQRRLAYIAVRIFGGAHWNAKAKC